MCPSIVRGASRWVLAPLLALALTGCEQQYRCETEVLPDGRVKRAVCQPRDEAPAAARDPRLWERVTAASSPDALDGPRRHGSLWDFPVREPSASAGYALSRGVFPSVEGIPGDVVIKSESEPEVPDGTLVREYSRTDYLFFVEHDWRETLTDCVTFDDMKRARKELVDLLIEEGRETFDAQFGDRYDASDLVKWVDTEGRAFLAEVTDAMFAGAAGGLRESERINDELAAICERHGLRLKKGGRFLKDEEMEKALQGFAIGVIAPRLRARDGHRVDPEEVRALFAEIDKAKDRDPEGAKAKAIQERIAARHGGKEALERRGKALGQRVFGLYNLRILDPARFDMTLTLPGEVVASNGEIVGPGRVRWRFKGTAAYPFGYAMRCRSFAHDARAPAMPGAERLADREAMIRFVDLVDHDERILGALKQCRDRGNFQPLLELRKTLAGEPESVETVKRVWEIIKSLKIPLD